MKVWKKNLVSAAVLVTVCAGIYVNWLYTQEVGTVGLTDTLDAEKVMGSDTLMLSDDIAAISAGEEVKTTASDYFAAVRLSRQEARDSAVNLLQEAMAYSTAEEGSGGKSVESAMELDTIVQTALSEAQIESLIIAKGYQDCVAYMTGEGISVAVAAPEGGLQRRILLSLRMLSCSNPAMVWIPFGWWKYIKGGPGGISFGAICDFLDF